MAPATTCCQVPSAPRPHRGGAGLVAAVRPRWTGQCGYLPFAPTTRLPAACTSPLSFRRREISEERRQSGGGQCPPGTINIGGVCVPVGGCSTSSSAPNAVAAVLVLTCSGLLLRRGRVHR